jgi:hypothetical protein
MVKAEEPSSAKFASEADLVMAPHRKCGEWNSIFHGGTFYRGRLIGRTTFSENVNTRSIRVLGTLFPAWANGRPETFEVS